MKRLGRLIVLAWLIGLAVTFIGMVIASPADAATTAPLHTQLGNLFASIPWAILAAWLLANVIPYLSTWLTKAPSWATGLWTTALSFVTAFLTDLAGQHGTVDWKLVIGNTFVTWAIARLHFKTFVDGTPTQTRLHAAGPQL